LDKLELRLVRNGGHRRCSGDRVRRRGDQRRWSRRRARQRRSNAVAALRSVERVFERILERAGAGAKCRLARLPRRRGQRHVVLHRLRLRDELHDLGSLRPRAKLEDALAAAQLAQLPLLLHDQRLKD
jgi:hypothetical protein